jgi:hypothetical protein
MWEESEEMILGRNSDTGRFGMKLLITTFHNDFSRFS